MGKRSATHHNHQAPEMGSAPLTHPPLYPCFQGSPSPSTRPPAPMPARIRRPFEPVLDIVHMLEPGRLRRLGRRHAARAAAADEIHMVVWLQIRLPPAPPRISGSAAWSGKTCHWISTGCLPVWLRSGTPTKFHSALVRTSHSAAAGLLISASQTCRGGNIFDHTDLRKYSLTVSGSIARTRDHGNSVQTGWSGPSATRR